MRCVYSIKGEWEEIRRAGWLAEWRRRCTPQSYCSLRLESKSILICLGGGGTSSQAEVTPASRVSAISVPCRAVLTKKEASTRLITDSLYRPCLSYVVSSVCVEPSVLILKSCMYALPPSAHEAWLSMAAPTVSTMLV